MKALLSLIVLLLLAFLVWPYSTIYQIDQALQAGDMGAFASHVDILEIKSQIKRKMNKNLESSIGEVSGKFIDWLQNSIQRLGTNAIDELVDHQWVAKQLRAHNQDIRQGGFFSHLKYAFFDGPDSLLLRIGELDDNPVHARLTLQDASWKITAIYN